MYRGAVAWLYRQPLRVFWMELFFSKNQENRTQFANPVNWLPDRIECSYAVNQWVDSYIGHLSHSIVAVYLRSYR